MNKKTDYVVTIDADLSYTFLVVEELIEIEKADVVITSMNHESEFSNASKIRVLIARVGNFII